MTTQEQEILSQLLQQYRDLPGALLPLLHAIQDAIGHVSDDAVPAIARTLNQSQAEVRGVISFYHDFRTTPPAAHSLRLCRAEACQSMGSEALAAQLRAQLGVDDHGHTADGQLELRPVYCLGACACAPALQLDGQLHARVTPEKLSALLASCSKEGQC
ncbi:formate dehydrogenase subunit gamma [Aquitalea sp. FJL05]|uniref:formate dehydrogenase subunit gamma n=1 Tax=Aquitalea sp. FJL05 TaxID=2153366 RepID=UPI000F5A07E2|nr:formate dehydrogenase subunit gamma [Aquitalea sp. FJL05]RQO76948.1 formate dehydrogenase subunit gamma [Aquitalea sp. FJL05]